VELRAADIGVDHDGVVVGIEHDDFEEFADLGGADEKDSIGANSDGGDRVIDGVEDVFVGDAVPACATGNLPNDNIRCQRLDVNICCQRFAHTDGFERRCRGNGTRPSGDKPRRVRDDLSGQLAGTASTSATLRA